MNALTDTINHLIDQIKAGKFEKIVISRTISANISRCLTIGKLFMKLKEKADSAFVYLVSLPGIGIWMGGTPELLLVKKKWRISYGFPCRHRAHKRRTS